MILEKEINSQYLLKQHLHFKQTIMELPTCPITHEVFTDPVVAADGHTYERSAIEQWFQSHNTSPLTGAIMHDKTLRPNYQVKQSIDIIKSLQHQMTPSSASVSIVAPATIVKEQPPITTVLQTFNMYGTQYITVELFCGSAEEVVADRKPVNIICVIDVSGSMGERATPYNPDGENDGFSQLDLVKHSLATIQKSLQPGDQIAIIAFSSNARMVLDLSEVSANDRLITDSIDSLQPDGTTNLWAGLEMACNLANSQDTKMYNTSIMLLTDGVANINPPRGVLPTFETFIKPMKGKFNINTFAYGYAVDSTLLSQIAAMTQGVFCYIPDGTMVGTVFINTMSAILSTVYNDVVIEVTNENNTPRKIYLGSILYGQPRTLLFPDEQLHPLRLKTITLSYGNGITTTIRVSTAKELILPVTWDYNIMKIIIKNALLEYLTYAAGLTEYTTDSITRLQDFVSKFNQKYRKPMPFIEGIIIDCFDEDPNYGQIGKSIEKKEWFDKWGKHYLKSILSAYRQEWCLNFKDLGPQHFTAATFKSFREKIETIFLGIAPPQPSIASPVSYGGAAQPPTYTFIPQQSYYNQDGGCFTGNWKVLLKNGTTKSVKDIVQGDIVVSNDSPTGYALITKVIRLRVNSSFQMCSPDGIKGITAYHPFWFSNPTRYRNWDFPTNSQILSKKSVMIHAGEYMYDFIIDRGYSVALEEGFNVACLGHGCQDSAVITHEYFGTHRVIDDLKDHEAWNTGVITLDEWIFVRNEAGLVCKLEW